MRSDDPRYDPLAEQPDLTVDRLAEKLGPDDRMVPAEPGELTRNKRAVRRNLGGDLGRAEDECAPLFLCLGCPRAGELAR